MYHCSLCYAGIMFNIITVHVEYPVVARKDLPSLCNYPDTMGGYLLIIFYQGLINATSIGLGDGLRNWMVGMAFRYC